MRRTMLQVFSLVTTALAVWAGAAFAQPNPKPTPAAVPTGVPDTWTRHVFVDDNGPLFSTWYDEFGRRRAVLSISPSSPVVGKRLSTTPLPPGWNSLPDSLVSAHGAGYQFFGELTQDPFNMAAHHQSLNIDAKFREIEDYVAATRGVTYRVDDYFADVPHVTGTGVVDRPGQITIGSPTPPTDPRVPTHVRQRVWDADGKLIFDETFANVPSAARANADMALRRSGTGLRVRHGVLPEAPQVIVATLPHTPSRPNVEVAKPRTLTKMEWNRIHRRGSIGLRGPPVPRGPTPAITPMTGALVIIGQTDIGQDLTGYAMEKSGVGPWLQEREAESRQIHREMSGMYGNGMGALIAPGDPWVLVDAWNWVWSWVPVIPLKKWMGEPRAPTVQERRMMMLMRGGNEVISNEEF